MKMNVKIKPDTDQLINTGLIRQHWNDPHMRNNPSNNLKPTHFLSGFILSSYIGNHKP